MSSHAQVPTVGPETDAGLRIYFSTRDRDNRSRTAWLDLDGDDISRVVAVCDRPVMDLAPPKSFDENGVMVSSVVARADCLFLYYTGWGRSILRPFHNSIGLAVSDDGGRTFERYSPDPIMDRAADEPFYCAQPTVMIDRGIWHMWYLSSTGWTEDNGRMEPLYHLRHAQSDDGIEWQRDPDACLPLRENEGGLVRPAIVKDGKTFHMWYSVRGPIGYRSPGPDSYRIGYAISVGGKTWNRKDWESGIDVSDQGWDSEMIAYPCVFDWRGVRYLLYNGNGFGRSGFGLARWID